MPFLTNLEELASVSPLGVSTIMSTISRNAAFESSRFAGF
jgi:hypothetical protein